MNLADLLPHVLPAVFAAAGAWGALKIELRWLRADLDQRRATESEILRDVAAIKLQMATRPCVVGGGRRFYDPPNCKPTGKGQP